MPKHYKMKDSKPKKAKKTGKVKGRYKRNRPL